MLTGNAGANKLYGLGGADTIKGGDGSDWIEGGAGKQISGSTYVSSDTNGDGHADFMIRLDRLHVLSSEDFVL